MAAGEYDRRALIQRPVRIRDADGGTVEGWADVATTWCKFAPLPGGGGESFKAGQRTAKQSAVFTLRYRPGLEPTMRLVYDGEPWEIEDVSDTGKGGRRRELALTAYAREVRSGP